MNPTFEPIEEDRSIKDVVNPAGFKILVRIPKFPEQMRRFQKIVLPDERRAAEEMAQLVAEVIALGPEAYMDRVRFPAGAWCKPGDVIMYRAYSGTRFELADGVVYALINDDTVQAVVTGDPGEISRVWS